MKSMSFSSAQVYDTPENVSKSCHNDLASMAGRPKLFVLDTHEPESAKRQLEVELRGLSKRSSVMQLYYSYQSVLGCQEAMWEELKDRIRNRKEELIEYGWEDDDDLDDLQGRRKFELLLERYRTWVAILSIYHDLTDVIIAEICKLAWPCGVHLRDWAGLCRGGRSRRQNCSRRSKRSKRYWRHEIMPQRRLHVGPCGCW